MGCIVHLFSVVDFSGVARAALARDLSRTLWTLESLEGAVFIRPFIARQRLRSPPIRSENPRTRISDNPPRTAKGPCAGWPHGANGRNY